MSRLPSAQLVHDPARFGALWLVAAGLISGVAVIGFGNVRWGGLLVAGSLVGAALLRLMLPRARAGGLVVRSRTADVAFLLIWAWRCWSSSSPWICDPGARGLRTQLPASTRC